jgi:hypothetical protein
MLTTSDVAVAVVGPDPAATGTAALELARMAAGDRLVTIVDLIGEASGLESNVLTHDAHGVADCFEYGVSFRAVARPTVSDAHIAIIPAGTEPIAYAVVLPSPRWTHFVDEARALGWLIIFAALTDTPELDALTSQLDHVLTAEPAYIAPPSHLAGAPPASVVDVSTAPVEGAITGNGKPARVRRRIRVRHRSPGGSLLPSPVIGVAAGLVLAALLGTWLIWRPRPSRSLHPGGSPSPETMTSTAQLATRTAALSTGSTAPGASALDAGIAVVDPADSARAAQYALRIGSFETYTDALRALRRGAVRFGAATISPVPVAGAQPSADGRIAAGPFLLYVAAGRTSADMDSEQHRWSASGAPSPGVVVRTPFALRLLDDLTPDSARRSVVALRARGLPAYALLTDAGRATVYAGAFQNTPEAASLSASLRAAGLAPALSYRVGRAL